MGFIIHRAGTLTRTVNDISNSDPETFRRNAHTPEASAGRFRVVQHVLFLSDMDRERDRERPAGRMQLVLTTVNCCNSRVSAGLRSANEALQHFHFPKCSFLKSCCSHTGVTHTHACTHTHAHTHTHLCIN